MITEMRITFITKCFIFCMALLSSNVFANNTLNASDAYPRVFVNADGSKTNIPAKPQRILSTSVTISGTLLAIEAPLIASASDFRGRFFRQWTHVAEERGVENVWSAGSVDLESAYIYEPDLIIVSWSGADSAKEQIAEFQQIAPTIVLDYSQQSWQDLAVELGFALGIENQAERKIQEFDQFVAASKQKIKIPEGQTNIISYFGAGATNAIALETGVHAKLLTDLGFDMESPNRAWHDNSIPMFDFIRVHFEVLPQLNAPTTFLLSADDKRAQTFMADPVLVNLPSVKERQVYGLGVNSFRIDLYSATEIVNDIVARFKI
ncbi:iron-enterobactin transporter periplasmic binding protein [Vibrio nigripulchritudo ATCC 27043]|nr:iron-enterobactin transporter periplasmic binding protein [Vibrio nigripulchritudo ATCC 27043]